MDKRNLIYQMKLIPKSIIKIFIETGVIFSILLYLNWNCAQNKSPSASHTDKRTKVSLLLGKKGTCTSCELINKYQWNFLYKIFGARNDIEFIVYCSNEIKKDIEQNFLFDKVLVTKKIPEDDVFTVYKEEKIIYQRQGVLDMYSVRQIINLLMDPVFEY